MSVDHLRVLQHTLDLAVEGDYVEPSTSRDGTIGGDRAAPVL